MRQVVLKNKVPVYIPYMQTLFNTKLHPDVVNKYKLFEPPLVALHPAPPDAPIYVPSSRAQIDDEAPKKKNVVVQALKKMKCFFLEKRTSEYKAYHKQKVYNRN